MMMLTSSEVELTIDAVRNQLQDLLDYANPKDYDPGELEARFQAYVDFLKRLGGTTAGLNGPNDYLLEGFTNGSNTSTVAQETACSDSSCSESVSDAPTA